MSNFVIVTGLICQVLLVTLLTINQKVDAEITVSNIFFNETMFSSADKTSLPSDSTNNSVATAKKDLLTTNSTGITPEEKKLDGLSDMIMALVDKLVPARSNATKGAAELTIGFQMHVAYSKGGGSNSDSEEKVSPLNATTADYLYNTTGIPEVGADLSVADNSSASTAYTPARLIRNNASAGRLSSLTMLSVVLAVISFLLAM